MTQTMEKPTAPVNSGGSGGRAARAGLVYALSAYVIWGFIPLYFRAISSVPPITILYHRIIWSALFLAVVLTVRAEWKFVWPVLRVRKNLIMLSAGALLIAANWLLFIYAVATKQLLQASLGLSGPRPGTEPT